jgi:multiple sugar transport system permease protein
MRSHRWSWRHGPAILVTLFFLAPLGLLLTGALRDPTLPPPRGPEVIPASLTFANLARADALVALGRATGNSLLVALIAVPAAVAVASTAGFAISRLPRRPRRFAIALSVAALMVPLTAVLVPRFTMFRAVGLTDTYVPLLAPALVGMTPLAVLLYVWAYRRQPAELFDAARVEGLSPLVTWWRLGMPLVKPVTATVAVLAFVTSWNNLIDPLVYLYEPSSYTLPLALRALAQLPTQQYPIMLAGALVATVPVVVAVVIGQRFARRTGGPW